MIRSVLMFAFRFECVVCLRFEVCWGVGYCGFCVCAYLLVGLVG